MRELKTQRIYGARQDADGIRILVDRLWPRGITKDAAGLDAWIKAVAPPTELRRAFHQGALSFEAFRRSYRDALDGSATALAFRSTVRRLLEKTDVTFLYAAKDSLRNNATVLREWVLEP